MVSGIKILIIKLCNIIYTFYISFRQFFNTKVVYISTREYQERDKLNPQQEDFMSRVLISMPEKFLDEIDKVADTENRSRSELIREALRTYIHRNQVRENTIAVKNATIFEALLD